MEKCLNTIGSITVLLFYPAEKLRALPIAGAQRLGDIAERKKYFPVAYTFSVFVGLPALYLAGMSAFSD